MSRVTELSLREGQKIAELFEGWEESTIWSFLQGVLGNGRMIECENGILLGQITVGDFTFLAGEADKADKAAVMELIGGKPKGFNGKTLFVVPKDDRWNEYIEETFGEACEKTVRYAIKKEPGIFNREKLEEMRKQLPEGYTIAQIDEKLYERAKGEEWSRDFCERYATWEDYEKFGLGFEVLCEGEPVCGASSYSHYKGGIEIEIVTREEHRQKGLASACAAALILECIERGLYPSWDAATKISVALAEKLGYNFEREYTTYKVDAAKYFK